MRVASFLGSFRVLASRFSLRTNLTLLLLAVVAILIVDRSNELTRIRSEKIASAKAEVVEAARGGADREADVVAGAKAVLRLAVDSPVAAADAGSACEKPFGEIAEDLPWLGTIWVVGTDGQVLCGSAGRYSTKTNIADRSYFREAIATGDVVVSDLLYGRLTGRPVIAAGMPRMKDGVVETVVAVAIELDWLSRIAAETGVSHGAEVLLLDSAATVIAAYPRPQSWIGRRFAGNKDFMAILKDTDRAGISDSVEGENRIIASARLRDTDVTLAVMLPLKGVIASANWLAFFEIAKIVLTALLSFAVIWIGGARWLMNPIRDLANGAARLGSGHLDTRISTKGLAPELKRLGDSFNDMATRLRAREDELRRANQRLSELASKDPLTGIANRRAFDDRLGAEWRRTRRDGAPLALLAIDVDHFKRFNDCYGHAEGDACLKLVAEILEETARRGGDLAARIGGEEFALLLPGTTLDDAKRIAEALREDIEALNSAYQLSPQARITVSVGVAAICGDRSEHMSDLTDRADAALYRAKHAGRNRIAFDNQAIALAS